MGRPRKQHLKQRADGRYACRYKDQWFYSYISEEDAIAQREEYKRVEALKSQPVPTVSEYATAWIDRAYPENAETTRVGLRIHLKKLTDAVGDELVTDVRPSQIKEVYSSRYLNKSNSYIKAAHQLFCALFDAVVADGYINSNPARERPARPHRGSVGGHRAITDQEREWINTYCKDHRFYPAVITMLYAGIRPQEAKAMKIQTAYDAQAGVLHIVESAHRDGNNRYKITGEGKTANAIRDIPVFPPVAEALKDRIGYLIPTARGGRITATTWRNAYNSYKFCMEKALNNGLERRWYKKTRAHKKILAAAEKLRKEGKIKEAEAKEAEIPPYIEFTVVPYDLRHSFCTMCRDNGVELHTCVEWMGHADATMIMKIYDEVSENRSEKEAEKLRKKLFGSQIGSQNNPENAESVENQRE